VCQEDITASELRTDICAHALIVTVSIATDLAQCRIHQPHKEHNPLRTKTNMYVRMSTYSII